MPLSWQSRLPSCSCNWMVLFSLYISFGPFVCLAPLIVFERSKRPKAGKVKRPILYRKAFYVTFASQCLRLAKRLVFPHLSGECHNNVTMKSFVGQRS